MRTSIYWATSANLAGHRTLRFIGFGVVLSSEFLLCLELEVGWKDLMRGLWFRSFVRVGDARGSKNVP